VAVLSVLVTGAGTALGATGPLTIEVLSNRADLISAGDALVEVTPPLGVDAGQIAVSVDGRDVTSQFAVRPNGRFMALLDGLRSGESVVSASAPGASAAFITITNHPIGGPVTAGEQIKPWTCFEETLDVQCNRPPKYEYLYKPTDGGGLSEYDPANPPSDVATTTTDQDKTVPFIVRHEIGSIDRDEYRIASLYDPSKPWAPWAPQDGYNHKLVVFHGASCDTAYEQTDAPDVLNETALARGFATMSHALNNAGHNCNISTQAESMIMTKERVVEQLGEIRYTIGSGCSGGALVQQQVANAYPGFYQGITPACSFTDAWSSAMQYVDYVGMRNYFEHPEKWEPGVAWAPDDIAAVEGHVNPINAITFTTAIPFSGEPSRSCPGVPDEQVYDENTNPTGVRCTLQDYMVNVFGTRDKSDWEAVEKKLGHGFAGRPFDNVGVEYGREALMNGTITQAQFTDLNVKIGGGDIDVTIGPDRIEADRPALERVYRSGAVNQATHLDRVAIIDLRGPDPGAFHDVYRTYAMRSRLEREHGTAANQVLWRGQVALFGDVNFVDEAILAVDEWLANVEKDPRDMPLGKKIIEDKPESLQDRCTNGAGTDLPTAECDTIVESYSSPRIEAGMPFTDDTIKCELAPLRKSHYLPLQVNDATLEALQGAFPQGICDYAKPGVDRVPTVPWLSYKKGPGGEPLGEVPASVPAEGPGALPGGSVGARPVDPSLDVRVKAPRLASDTLRGRNIRLRIRGKRGLAGISHLVLQYRRTGRGTKRAYTTLRPRLAKSAKRVSFRKGKIGETYLFRITAVGTNGKRSRFRDARTVLPYDDRGKGRRYSRGWRRIRNGRAWQGGYSQTSRRGATLDFATRGGGRIYLIARTGPGGGRAVFGRGSKKRVVSFRTKTRRNRRVVAIVNRTQKRVYRFRLRVLSGTVTVDGLGVRRR
jgi:hypothetical protein